MELLRKVLWLAVAALALSGCGGTVSKALGGHNNNLVTVSVDETNRTTEDYVRVITEALGNPKVLESGTGEPTPCEGRGGEVSGPDKYWLLNITNIAVPPEQQVRSLDLLHRLFERSGWDITHYGNHDIPKNPGGAIEGRNPNDGFKLSIMTSSTSTAMTIWVSSPCRKTPSDADHSPNAAAAATAHLPGSTAARVNAANSEAIAARIRDVLG